MEVLLSVVLPVLNGRSYIREAVEGILNQTWEEFELLIVDNGSTDGTIGMIECYDDPRIHLLQERRKGVSAAFNHGWSASRGTYVVRMDADDVSCPTRFERQIRYLQQHGDVGILGAQALRIDEVGHILGCTDYPLDPVAIRHISRFVFPLATPTTVCLRSVLIGLGGWREFAPGADYDLLLRALDEGVRVANLPEVLIKYRVRSGSVSHVDRSHTSMATFAVKRMQSLRQKGRAVDESRILHLLATGRLRRGMWLRMVTMLIQKLTSVRPIRRSGIPPSVVGVLHPLILYLLWSKYRAGRLQESYRRAVRSKTSGA